jgi:hypothetical protein
MEDRKQEIERWLDAGLKQYSRVDPRIGLEARTLASVRAAQKDPAWQSKIVPSLLAAMLVIGTILFLGRARWITGPPVAPTPSASNIQIDVQAGFIPVPAVRRRRHTATTLPATRHSYPPKGEPASPRLEQFPSQRPLSEQEQMLAQYVQDSPQQATMLAQARALVLKQDLAAFEKLNAEPPQDKEQ